MPVAITLSGFQIVLIAVFAVAAVGIVVVLLTDDRDPTTVIAWLLVVTLLPIVGVVFYFFIGRNYRRETPLRQRILGEVEAEAAHVLSSVYESCGQFTAKAEASLSGTSARKLAAMGRRAGGTPDHAGDERRAVHGGTGQVRRHFSTICEAPATTSTSCT